MSKIERIYITRGDNCYDSEGRKCDKLLGLVIDGKIHWINTEFADLSQRESLLEALGISILKLKSTYVWGHIDSDGSAELNNRVTKIAKHHDDIFSTDSSYIRKTLLKPDGGMWWDLYDIMKKLNIPVAEEE